jgi:hypothetical protein
MDIYLFWGSESQFATHISKWIKIMTLEVIAAVNTKIKVIWDVNVCSLVDRYNISEEPAAFFFRV